jgi:hypothetical protein
VVKKPKKPKKQKTTKTTSSNAAPADAQDFASLWFDPGLGDGITDAHHHSIPVDRPKDFFRVHPNKEFRRKTEVYTHKAEGVVGETHYIIAPSMRGRIGEARPCTIVVAIYRDGTLRLWPIKHPREGERDNEAWITSRNIARRAIDQWVKLLWVNRSFQSRDAQEGYAPDPDWSKLPSFDELVRVAFGAHGVIRDESHQMFKDLFGLPSKKAEGGGDDL